MRKLKSVMVALFSSLSLAGGAVSAAAVEDQEFNSVSAEDVVRALENINPDALDSDVNIDEGSDSYQVQSDDVSVRIPKDSGESVNFSSHSGEVDISIPFSGSSNEWEVISENSFYFGSEEGVATTASIRDGSSIQFHSVISGPESSTLVKYDINIVEGGDIDIDEEGFVSIVNSDGDLIAGVAPAWAKDASGADVPTWYEVRDGSLVQVIQHNEGYQYPVVADPFLGKALFKNIWRGWYQNDYSYNGSVTAWGGIVMSGGGGVGGYLAGQAAMRKWGWQEWVNAYPAITNKATLKHQFDCHVAASTYGLPFTGEYNLERFRSDKSNWALIVLSHRCNW